VAIPPAPVPSRAPTARSARKRCRGPSSPLCAAGAGEPAFCRLADPGRKTFPAGVCGVPSRLQSGSAATAAPSRSQQASALGWSLAQCLLQPQQPIPAPEPSAMRSTQRLPTNLAAMKATGPRRCSTTCSTSTRPSATTRPARNETGGNGSSPRILPFLAIGSLSGAAVSAGAAQLPGQPWP